jgi:hypothetical protein
MERNESTIYLMNTLEHQVRCSIVMSIPTRMTRFDPWQRRFSFLLAFPCDCMLWQESEGLPSMCMGGLVLLDLHTHQ